MPNIKSQVKRLRQSEKRRIRRKAVKSAVKTKIADYRQALESKDKEQAEKRLAIAVRALDKAASKGVIHPNQASNKKSKLMRKIKAAQA